ncbi:hypothetical protein BDV06DRAFT_62489 [Aspergillus oleicola]
MHCSMTCPMSSSSISSPSMSSENSSPPQKGIFPLLELPEDIFWIIAGFLPVASRACFALSCKAVYSSIFHVLEDGQLSWPKLFGSMSLAIKKNLAYYPRTILLKKLEDHRWRCCFRCLKLHPSFWVSPWCPHPEIGGTPWIWSCHPQMNVVDLCPCLALTWSDGQALWQWLRVGNAEKLYFPPSIREALQLQIMNGHRVLQHHCSATDDPDELVEIKLALCLDVKNRLEVQTRHEFYFKTPQPDHRGMYPRLRARHSVSQLLPLCPRVDARHYIHTYPPGNYNGCCSSSHKFEISRSENRLYGAIKSIRNLGNLQEPENWRRASRSEMSLKSMIK